MAKNSKEFLTGVVLGLILTILLAVKVMASPVGDPYEPGKAEIDEAKAYLEEYQIKIPEDVEEACEYYGKKYGICPETLEAICWVESNCIPSVQSQDKSCKGLMQIKPSCHQDRMNKLNARNVFGIWDNIEVGTDYLCELLKDDSGDIAVALTLYNGQSRAKVEKARKGEYSKYVKKILRISGYLEIVHGK